MTDTQREYYDGDTEIGSDPFHVLDRDNRNHQKKQALICERVNADPGERVLEVGCGDGLHAPGYAKRFAYAGVDLSPTLVEQTRARVDSVTDSWTVLAADVLDLPWADDTFGAVVGTAILHHLPDPEAALREWVRVTAPGGSVTLMEPNYLFPKDLLETHAIPAERHKVNIRPSRVGDVCAAVTPASGAWSVEPRIYTPPWPDALTGLYDALDSLASRVPLARWASMMLLIHVEVGE